MTVLAEIRFASLREEAARAIEAAIAVGEITPGEIYSAPTLARGLGVSATPVREALLALTGRGVVESVRNRDYRVVPPTRHDAEDVLELRRLVEPTFLGRLAGRLNETALDELEQLLDAARARCAAEARARFLALERELTLRPLEPAGCRAAFELLVSLRDYADLAGCRRRQCASTQIA